MKGWKTVLFNIAAIVLTSPDVIALIPPETGLYVVTIGNIVLRAITTTPIGKSEPKQ